MINNKPKFIHRVVNTSVQRGWYCPGAEVTKLKLINRIGEVWSARSPPPAADALPSSPTLPEKQSFAENPSVRVTNSEYLLEAVPESYR